MFTVSLGAYELYCKANSLPDMLPEYQKRAVLVESFDLAESGGSAVCFCAVRRRYGP